MVQHWRLELYYLVLGTKMKSHKLKYPQERRLFVQRRAIHDNFHGIMQSSPNNAQSDTTEYAFAS